MLGLARNITSVKDKDLSMVFRELYPIVAAAVLWRKQWTIRRIVLCVITCQQCTYLRRTSQESGNNKAYRYVNMDFSSEHFYLIACHLCSEQINQVIFHLNYY